MLAEKAEALYLNLSESQQKVVRRVFLRLARLPGSPPGSPPGRIEISELNPKIEDAPSVDETLRLLAEAGLVTLSGRSLELANEALVQAWARLAGWLEEDADLVRQIHALASAAREWRRRRRSADHLLKEPVLSETEAWVQSHPGVINFLEQEYLNASRLQADHESSAHRASTLQDILALQKQSELERQRADSYKRQAEAERSRALDLNRAVNRQRIFLWIFSLLSILAVITAALAFNQWYNANDQAHQGATLAAESRTQAAGSLDQAGTAVMERTAANNRLATAQAASTEAARQQAESLRRARSAQANQLAAQSARYLTSQPDLALLLSAEAYNLEDNHAVRSSLLAALAQNPPLYQILQAGGARTRCAAFSPDGKILATGGDDALIVLWNLESGQRIGQPLSAHTAPVLSLAFSADGQTLASSSEDQTIRFWNVASRQPSPVIVRELLTARSLAFHPAANLLAAGGVSSRRPLYLIDPATGKPLEQVFVGLTGSVESLAFSPDGKYLAAAGWDRTILVWDSATGRLAGPPLGGHTDTILSIAFSPNGKTIASASADKTIRLWDLTTFRMSGTPLQGHTNQVTSLSFSAVGDLLASASLDGTLRIWDASGRQASPRLLKGHKGDVLQAVFQPKSRLMVSTGEDGAILVWDAARDQPLGNSILNLKAAENLAVSPRGDLFAASLCTRPDSIPCEQSEVQVWDLQEPALKTMPFKGFTVTQQMAFNQDSSLLAVAGCYREHTSPTGCLQPTIRLWETTSEKPLPGDLEGHLDAITSLVFSPDGQFLASSSRDKTVRLWDAVLVQPTGPVLKGHSDGVASLAYSPDGRLLASGSWDRTIRIWNTSTWLPVTPALRGHSDGVTLLAFSPNGRLLASSGADRVIRLWDTQTWKTVAVLPEAQTGGVAALAFSPDSSLLVFSSADTSLRLWTLWQGAQINLLAQGVPLLAHREIVRSLAFRKDGKTLYSASIDSLRAWDLEARRWFESACRVANRNLTRLEWQQFLLGESYRKTCPQFNEGE